MGKLDINVGKLKKKGINMLNGFAQIVISVRNLLLIISKMINL